MSDYIKEYLASIQRSLDYPIRHVAPKDIHLTLNFLGDEDTALVMERLRTVRFDPFSLKLSTLQLFPPHRPQLLWMTLEDSKELLALQCDIDKLFTPQKSFRAHLTLARLGRLLPAETKRLAKDVDVFSVQQLSFSVSSFKLVKSTLTSVGPIYEVLETFTAQ